MELIQMPIVGFLLIFVATVLLFGELLVKAKGIFGLCGIGLMSMYFSVHFSIDQLLLFGVLYGAGFLLIVLDGKLINDGMLALLGVAVMAGSLAVPAPTIVYGILVCSGFVAGAALSLLLLKVLPARKVWSKVILRKRLTTEEGYSSINSGYRELIGKTGVAITSFHPVGTVKIDGEVYSAISEGNWIHRNTKVTVVSVDGTKIVIREAITSSSLSGLGDSNDHS